MGSLDHYSAPNFVRSMESLHWSQSVVMFPCLLLRLTRQCVVDFYLSFVAILIRRFFSPAITQYNLLFSLWCACLSIYLVLSLSLFSALPSFLSHFPWFVGVFRYCVRYKHAIVICSFMAFAIVAKSKYETKR